MELKIIEESKNKLLLEIKGENNTFCNALKEELYNNKKVKTASYKVKHPLVGKITMLVETTSGEDPKKALADASKKLKKNADKFKSLIK